MHFFYRCLIENRMVNIVCSVHGFSKLGFWFNFWHSFGLHHILQYVEFSNRHSKSKETTCNWQLKQTLRIVWQNYRNNFRFLEIIATKLWKKNDVKTINCTTFSKFQRETHFPEENSANTGRTQWKSKCSKSNSFLWSQRCMLNGCVNGQQSRRQQILFYFKKYTRNGPKKWTCL